MSAPASPDPGDDNDTLRARLEPMLRTLYYDGVPLIDVVWPLIEKDRTRHGRQQAARAVRDAATPHIPTLTRLRSGAWGVFCEACSSLANDYVEVCKLRADTSDWPPLTLHAGRQQ